MFAWFPYFYFVSIGRDLSVFPFLAVHLTGVIGGAWLRNSANKDKEVFDTLTLSELRRKLISRILIYLGVLAWAPYIYLTRVQNLDVDVSPFLIAHLSGVLGGAVLRASISFKYFKN